MGTALAPPHLATHRVRSATMFRSPSPRRPYCRRRINPGIGGVRHTLRRRRVAWAEAREGEGLAGERWEGERWEEGPLV